jgi:hypothetical protein
MQNLKKTVKLIYFLFVLLFSFSIMGCQFGNKADRNKTISEDSEMQKEEEQKDGIKVVTQEMEFQMEDTLASGWQTFHYHNESEEPHFILLGKYPDDKTIDDARAEVIPAFQKGMNQLSQGNTDEAMTEFGKLPDWFQDVEYLGGTGLISSGKVATTTLNLEPGYYLFECYVKINGVFHSTMGMIKEVIVINENSGNTEPAADIEIRISSEKGITYSDSITSGKHVFAVHFDDQMVYDHFVGHDVHLVKLHDNYNKDSLIHWMNWSVPGGLDSPAPGNVTFLGGVNDMPSGSTAYFTAELDEGNYAFIAEVPNADTKNMFREFKITK